MGIRGHVQVVQPVHGGNEMSSWISNAAYKYLTEDAGLSVYAGDMGADSDRWEIEIPSIERMKEVSKDLHENPDALDKYFSKRDFCGLGTDDLVGQGRAEELACLLDEGIEAAEKNRYDYIIVEWY